MSSRIRSIPIESEAALEQLVLADPGNLEEGLSVLDNQVAAGSGFIDILAVDSSDKSLVIVELKKEESDRMLVQTLEYYDFVRENIERFASAYRHKHEIDAQAEPRIILVAHSFSESLQVSAKYVNAPVSLYQYEYLQAGDQRGLYLTEVPISSPREFKRRRKSPQEHLEHIADAKIRALCADVMKRIMDLDPANITIKGLRGRIAFKHGGRNLANVHPRQTYFYLNWRGRWKERVRIEDASDVSDEMFAQIKQAMKTLAAGPDGDDDSELEEEAESQ